MANPTQSTRSRKATAGGSTRTTRLERPKKPYPGFPLTPHPGGKWQKKIRGKIHYFGRWAESKKGEWVRTKRDGWEDALEAYKRVADDLHAGRTPRADTGGVTVRDLCNSFDRAKQRKLDAGEITQRTYDDYVNTTDRIVAKFGKERLVEDLHPEDFAALRADMARTWGPVRLGNEIQRVRVVFKHGFDAGLIDRPMRFGPEFKKPSAKTLRKHRHQQGERMLEPGELRKLIEAAPDPLKAMILLGLNAGFGNHDIATLPMDAIDLSAGWVRYPRPKTGIPRRCPLWPETIEALRDALDSRPVPKHADAEGLVFVTLRGRQWLVRGIANPVSVACRNAMKAAGVHRKGIGFYTLRHIFRTVADETGDMPAVRMIMGHLDPNAIDDIYRERIDDSRLRKVTDHVRAWLFPENGGEK